MNTQNGSTAGEHPGDTVGGPLHGVRVVDLTSVIMGPLATQVLGDLGADVITFEAAGGETNRFMSAGPHPQLSGIALNILRNKRNVSVNLKDPAGREVLLRIASTADVFVTNLRPGPLQRLGLDYEALRAVRPDIVFCRAAGYPSDSPEAEEPAYDDVIQAATGIADAARLQTGAPTLAPTILADKVCGYVMAYSIIAALFARERTGQGQQIELPMVDAMSAFTLVEHGAAAISETTRGPAGYPRILTPNRRPQRTADGWIHILPYSERHYDDLFNYGGRSELVGDPRYRDGRSRIANADFLYAEVHAMAPNRTTAEWLQLCREHKIPATEVATLDDLVQRLPVDEHPVAGKYRSIPSPARFSGTPTSVRRQAPMMGEHNTEVLREAGYTIDEIESLEASGTLRGKYGVSAQEVGA